MTTESTGGTREIAVRDTRVEFTYCVVDGDDPSHRSSPQQGFTRSLSLKGLIFEPRRLELDGLHLSFAASGFGRNSLEITLNLGKKHGLVELFGEVEWYEKRITKTGEFFIVGVSFADIRADSLTVLRDFLKNPYPIGRIK